MHLSPTPTEKLLLCCARSRIDDRLQESIGSLIKEKINWERFITSAKSHRIAPNCYLHLKKSGAQIPGEIEKRLYEIYNANLIRNMKLWAVLKKILRALNQAYIEAIPLKGPFLSDHIHGHIGIRSSSDLDILIKKKDYYSAKKAMAKIGYFPIKRPYSEEFIMDFLRHRAFREDKRGILDHLVEIHWNFYPQQPQKFNMAQVWKTAVPKNIENTPFFSLSPTYTLIHLAINMRLHGYLNFRLLVDMNALLKHLKDKINWKDVIKQAVINKQRVSLFYALYFTRELLDAEISPHILKHTKPGWVQHKLVSFFINPQKILSAEKEKNLLFYWDIVRLLTIDSFKGVFKTFYKISFSASEDVIKRYKKSGFSEKPQLSTILRSFHLSWIIVKNLFKLLKR